jgi:hypothetical protein
MDWILDGRKVEVNYCGATGSGTVVDSRVKYGGSVQYTVELDEGITLPWRSELVYRVLVDNKDILSIDGVNTAVSNYSLTKKIFAETA